MRNILIIVIMLLISACGHDKINIKADPVEPVVIHPPVPDQLQLREVKWTVFNRAKLEQLLADYPNQEIVLFALSAKGYENLSLNVAEILRYLKEQKGVIIYYRETFPEAPIDFQQEGEETEE